MIRMGVYRLPDRHSKYLARKTAIPFRAFLMWDNAQNALEQKGMLEMGVVGCLYLPFYKHPKCLARRRQSVPGLFSAAADGVSEPSPHAGRLGTTRLPMETCTGSPF